MRSGAGELNEAHAPLCRSIDYGLAKLSPEEFAAHLSSNIGV